MRSVTRLHPRSSSPEPHGAGRGNSGDGKDAGNAHAFTFDGLRAALERNHLQIFAQRIAPFTDVDRTSDVECLVRLIGEDGIIVPPAQLLPAAAHYHLMTAVDEWMIENTLAKLDPHAATLFERHVHVAFNLSEQALCDPEFLRFVEDRIALTSLDPTLITFEISESVAARNLARTDEVMGRLRKLGCSIALDDFGARLVSLGHLQTLKPDRVKIASAVVQRALDSFESEAIIRTIVKLADALYVECVAKHVDSNALANKLRSMGVGYVQGNCVHAAEPLTQWVDKDLLT